jgi:Ser/Thr protein kinase RdoA (MazF antagonist)
VKLLLETMDGDGLCEWVAREYAVGRPVACELLRSYTNDVYAVRMPEERFVLKVYGRGWRTGPEIRYEVALIQHLSARGLPTATPLVGRNGDVLQEMESSDGCRHAVLYVFAPGEKPRPPFTPPLYHAFGRAMARMHALSDNFVTEHQRRPLDLSLLIDEPLSLAAPLLARREDREFLVETADRVKQRIRELASEGLEWGPIHGDATLDNLHVTADGEVVLYDFDSGGPGWRAADLQGWAANNAEHREKWEAFQQGYSEVRTIKPADLLAAPYLDVAWDLWGIKIDLDNRVLRQGRERTRAYLREQVAQIRERARLLL